MNELIIGCDPDSDKSGWAVVKNGKLITVTCKSLVEIFEYFNGCKNHDKIELHIENVNGISAAFNARDKKSPLSVKLKMAQHVGMCKQAQIEIERIAEHFGVKVVRHPVSKMWKDSKTGKAALKETFGYDGQSNEDTRSAAWFAYVGLRATIQK